ncbi:MAG: DUF4340 domain-containing protein, partial [Nitrospinota bacterium]|nr:DUF4340 domain-containing protein [Nitrospinota bacterium]
KDLAAFGLKPPQLTVRYELEGGGKGRILFGQTSPSGEGVYMAIDGSKTVYLLSTRARSPFEKTLHAVRDKTLLRRPRNKIAQITFERDGGRFVLKKNEKGKWALVEPIKARGNIEGVNYALGLILDGKAQKFIVENPTADDLKRFGLASPKVRLTLAEAGGKNPDVFLIGSQEEKSKNYYARQEDRGPIFQLERFSVEDLPKKPLAARNRRIIEFEKEAVVRIELESPQGKVTIRQTDGKKDEWEVEGDGLKLAGNDRRISDMLWDIKYAKIAEFFADPAKQPNATLVDRTTRKVALHIKGKEKPLRFTIGRQGPSDPTQKDKEDQERWYARRTDDGTVFLLTRDTVDRVSKGVWDLQERKALKFPYNKVAKLGFGYPDGAVELVKEGRRWRMMKPLDEIAVGDKLDFILNEINFLEFEEIVKEKKPDFSKPDLVVDVFLKDGKKLPTLRFVRNAKEKKAYVRRGDEPRVYAIEDRFIDNVPKSYKGFLSKE